MSTAQRIFSFLAENAGRPLCDDCITSGVGLSSRQQVHPITTAFGLTRDFDRRDGLCAGCATDKLTTQMVHDGSQ